MSDYITTETKNRERGYRLLRILLTDVCNLSCSYCKVMPNIVEVTKHATSPDNLERAIRIFFEGSVATTPKIVHVSGGEPLIAWDSVTDIVSLVESYKRVGEERLHRVRTNGILLNEERVRFLAEHDIKAIVSMDGREETHDTLRRKHGGQGSFRQVDAEVRLLNRFGVELGLSMVVGKHNVHQLIPKSHLSRTHTIL